MNHKMDKQRGQQELDEDVILEKEQVIVFKQADEEYGLRIDQIKEVVITPNITNMPQTPDYIKGVANIRGNIIAILDLEKKFGLKSDAETDEEKRKGYTLVVESDEFKIGILVNEVPNTLNIPKKDIEEASDVVISSQVEQDYIEGIIKLKDKLVILIDIFKVLSDRDKQAISNQQSVA